MAALYCGRLLLATASVAAATSAGGAAVGASVGTALAASCGAAMAAFCGRLPIKLLVRGSA